MTTALTLPIVKRLKVLIHLGIGKYNKGECFASAFDISGVDKVIVGEFEFDFEIPEIDSNDILKQQLEDRLSELQSVFDKNKSDLLNQLNTLK